MKILIIEDDTTTREFVAKGLEEHGYAVDQAEDGKKGLMMALSSEYQLVILDRMLPNLDGMKVLSAIKATEENRTAEQKNSRVCIASSITPCIPAFNGRAQREDRRSN